MPNLKVAVAQISSVKGNIDSNITNHLKAIEKASALGVSYIVFPELSLTGYEPEIAKKLAFHSQYKRLKPLIDSAKKNILLKGKSSIMSLVMIQKLLMLFVPILIVLSMSVIALHREHQFTWRVL